MGGGRALVLCALLLGSLAAAAPAGGAAPQDSVLLQRHTAVHALAVAGRGSVGRVDPVQAQQHLASLVAAAVSAGTELSPSELAIITDIVELLQNSTLPAIRQDHGEDANETAHLFAEIGRHADKVEAAAAIADSSREDVAGRRAAHAQCRRDLKGIEDDNETACKALAGWLESLTPSCAVPEPRTPAAVSDFLRSGVQWFNTSLQQFASKERACSAASGALASNRTACGGKQGDFEHSFCSNCADVDGLQGLLADWRASVESYLATRAQVNVSIASRKLSLVATSKAMCYLQSLHAGNNTERALALDACKTLLVDTTSLDIDLPAPPAEPELLHEVCVDDPADESFRAREYGHLPTSTLPGEACPRTSGAAPASTTPGPVAAAPTSCAEIDWAGREDARADGEYELSDGEGQTYTTRCAFFSKGQEQHAATLIGRVSVQGSSWTYATAGYEGLGADSGDATPWETSQTFGGLAGGADYKNPGWWGAKGWGLRVTYNDALLLQTGAGCLGVDAEEGSFREALQGLSWSCGGGVPKSDACAVEQRCSVDGDFPSATTEARQALGTNPSNLLLQFGERNGAQDANRDRVYIATDGVSSAGVDWPQGLGSFMTDGNSIETSVNVGSYADTSVSVGGTGQYGIWVVSKYA